MTQEPLETIACSSAIDCDVIAATLASHLESLSDDGPLAEVIHDRSKNGPSSSLCSELEIEIRLGIIRNIHDGQRFTLPAATDSLLSERAQVTFVPGVSDEQFKAARLFMAQLTQDNITRSQWEQQLDVATLDRFFKMSDYKEPFRISVPQDQTASRQHPLVAIRKVKLVTWNVSSGDAGRDDNQNEDIGDAKHEQLDYRISINIEHKKRLADIPTSNSAIMCRKKTRDSFIHGVGNLRVDMSKVQSVNESDVNDKGKLSYEIELELNGDTIMDTLADKTRLYSIRRYLLRHHCTTLIRAVNQFREQLNGKPRFTEPSNSGPMLKKIGLCDFRLTKNDDTDIKRYLQYVSPQLPLIGDYLFRAVAPAIEKSKTITDRRSPYRDHIDEIPGPFLVMEQPEGKKVMLMKLDRREERNQYT